MKKQFTLYLVFWSFSSLFAQNASLEIASGFYGGVTIFDGYFVSAQVKIPLNKTFEIAPLFTMGKSFSTSSYNSIMITETTEIVGYETGKFKPNLETFIYDSYDVLLLIKPLEIFGHKKHKNDFIIGTGFGFKSVTELKMKYEKMGQTVNLKFLSIKEYKGFEPYYLKINYNYYIKNKYYLGGDLSINSIDGEGLAQYGIKFGVKF